ncbi:OVARIAN TUMOR DOMAIN-containing deubiquitinating enzyme 7-like isoform X1 [Primulina huaijiensis]|uniref:OVARIAN TUMOR DOMAIN-containing deubiquitinating enzyme 7-like isoform X1 n=1 Tax=Primulina huaijiensis TaxID=1492673 RepID=UPI003CC744E1
MAKGKHRTINSNKIPHRKKRGRETDVSELRAELDVLGLKIILVTPDGNCFFRALADQLEGNEDKHEKYRNMVVRFIKNNREMFEPFLEDEVPFDEYCRSMAQEGNWAGHVELQAASLATHRNICIHRHRSPRWHAQNFDVREAPQIHLSYHDGEHYNSVRLKEDTCSGPARPIFIEDNTGLSAKSNKADVVCTVPEKEGGENILQEKSSNIVNATKAQQALNVGGDIVAELLTPEQESGDHMFADLVVDSPYDEHQDMNCVQQELRVEHKALEHDLSSNDVERVCSMNSPRANQKKFFKNKACLHGLKKKHKSCCRSVAGKSEDFPCRTDEHRKNWKDRKPGQKGAASVANSIQCNGRSPDLGGSLCP